MQRLLRLRSHKPPTPLWSGIAADVVTNAACPGPSTCLQLSGLDGVLGTADDNWVPLNNFQRQILITNAFLPNGAIDNTLRSITVTITYTTTSFKATQKTFRASRTSRT